METQQTNEVPLEMLYTANFSILVRILRNFFLVKANHLLYNIAEVSSGFHQADWSTTFGIVYCYPISFFLFWFICVLVYRNLILTISAQMKTSAQFKFALYITND